MPVLKLSQSMLATLKCPAGKRRIEYCDSEVPGLYLEVRDTQNQTYYWRTKDASGKTVHQKVGRVSDITLADARSQVISLKDAHTETLHNPQAKKKECMLLNDLWDEYYEFAQSTLRSSKRLEQLWRIRIQPRFGAMKLRDITLRQIQTFLMDIKKEGLSAASVDHHGKLLRRMGNMAVRWGYLDTSFGKGIQLYNQFNGVENVLADEQLQKLINVLNTDSNRPICLIALYLLATGARLNEVLSAQWKNVSIENRLWIVPQETAKAKRPRSIPLNDSALEILQKVQRKESDVFVFTNAKTKKRFVNVFKPWSRIRSQAGVPFLRMHDLRHMYATYLVNNGRSLYEVSKLLGHADGRCTARYAHLDSRTLLEAANSVSTKLSDVMRVKKDVEVMQEAA